MANFKPKECDARAYLPTKEEIAQKCKEIQEQWTDTTRKRRCTRDASEPWVPPEVTVHFPSEARG